jgi:urease accessory protein
MPMGTDTTSLLMLLNWMSPTFPIGSFAYSHGLESAIGDGRVTTPESLQAWIADLLHHGSGWNDAIVFALCWTDDVEELNALSLALTSSAERYAETTQLGRNFRIATSVWTGLSHQDQHMSYPVAAGIACNQMGIPREQALLAYLQGFCAALVSVAVRLVPLGQTRGLEVLRNIAPVMSEVAKRAAAASREDLGGACLAADIASMQHETLNVRIFRS